MMIFLQILFFLFIALVAYTPYKGKNFKNVNWKTVIKLCIRFLLCSLILLVVSYKNIVVSFNLTTIIIFMSTTLIWIFMPKIIRRFGKYPKDFLQAKKNRMRFMAKLEPMTMTIKYFEVLFQQSLFLFIFFVVLGNLLIDKSIFWFTLIIAIFHLGNFLFMDIKWVLFYFVLSIPMAILFGHMLSQGLVLLTASIHLAFYLVFNTKYWFTIRPIMPFK